MFHGKGNADASAGAQPSQYDVALPAAVLSVRVFDLARAH